MFEVTFKKVSSFHLFDGKMKKVTCKMFHTTIYPRREVENV